MIVDDDQLPYFGLNEIPGVMELERVEESDSGPIAIPNSLIFGDDILDTIYVSRISITANGLRVE